MLFSIRDIVLQLHKWVSHIKRVTVNNLLNTIARSDKFLLRIKYYNTNKNETTTRLVQVLSVDTHKNGSTTILTYDLDKGEKVYRRFTCEHVTILEIVKRQECDTLPTFQKPTSSLEVPFRKLFLNPIKKLSSIISNILGRFSRYKNN